MALCSALATFALPVFASQAIGADAAGRGQFCGDQYRSALPQPCAQQSRWRRRSSTRLVDMDAQAHLVPGLATSWKLVAPDTWELKLRDAKFQNGNAFTADDVVFTLDRIPQGAEQPEQLRGLHQACGQHRDGRSPHHPAAHEWCISSAADLSGAVRHHQSPDGRRHGDRGLQQRQGGHRHRAVSLRLIQARRPHRTGSQ